MFRFALVTSVLIWPCHVASAEFAHCYTGDTPADAPLASDQNLDGLMFSLQVAYLRHACGAETDADKAMLAARVAEGGCSDQSEIAQFAMDTFAPEPTDAKSGLLADAGGDADLLDALCTAAAQCTPDGTSYDAGCERAVNAAMGR